MKVPDPMPAIQKVAGVPPGVVKTVAQHVGVVIRFVSDSNVKVNAAELYELPPIEPLPVPEKVIVRGSALTSAATSNPVDSNPRFTQGSPGKLSLFVRPAVLLVGHAGTLDFAILDFAIIVSRRSQTSAPAFIRLYDVSQPVLDDPGSLIFWSDPNTTSTISNMDGEQIGITCVALER